MNTVHFLSDSLGRKSFLALLVSVLILTLVMPHMAWPQANQTNKQKIVQGVAQRWIQVGSEQYQRGMYKAAEQSFLFAKDYEAYLTVSQLEKLNKLLEKSHNAVIERDSIIEKLALANELTERNKPDRAKELFEQIKDNQFLTDAEKTQIAQKLTQLESKANEEAARITELYNNSIKLYDAGKFEQARKGFLEVAKSGLISAGPGQSPEDYLVIIDNILAQQLQPAPVVEEITQPEPESSITIDVAKDKLLQTAKPAPERTEVVIDKKIAPKTVQETYIDVVNRKRNILRSHTKAVVNSAIDQAQNCVNTTQFDQANQKVEDALRIVNKNQIDIGEELYQLYLKQLKQLSELIANRGAEKQLQLQEQKRLEAIEAQRLYRDQTERERQRRIEELMENAIAYQKQQRYEESLGQMESLLAIDPLNDHALILKQTLEDTINFRRQLEIQKESESERVGTLIKTDISMIPYARELTYPKNWREIDAKRKPDEVIGKDPATTAVYKQLEEVVDLSVLNPEMTFGEAVEEFRNSIEPSLKIVVLWRDLYDNADIEQTTPINMDPVSAVPLGTALELLLKSVSGGFAELGYVVDDGIITIATVGSLPSEMVTRVYDVTDLLGRRADYISRSTGGTTVSTGDQIGGEGFDEQDELGRDELQDEAEERAENLILLIQETIEPETWYEAGGEGTITVYENKKLIVLQTRKVHSQIEKLLNEMRKSFGHQISIEARFLLVGENFLEDIGLEIDAVHLPQFREKIVDVQLNSQGELEEIIELEPTRNLLLNQGHHLHTEPRDTQITGSLASLAQLPGLQLGFGGLLLDNLQVDLLLRATQAHRDSTSLTAPKVSVLSGESASMRVQRTIRYAREVEPEIREIGTEGDSYINVRYQEGSITTGTILNITPTITPDKKNVLLNITAELVDFLGWVPYTYNFGLGDMSVEFPETEISKVQTRVSVPDGGTLLLGGQKVTAEVELESGVPILSKIPYIGRMFSNRSVIRDQKILLILVQPTIILQEEAEAEAIAAIN